MKTKLSTENLCDYCDYNIPECGAENIEFGNGFGNDNVVTCDSFSGPYPEKTVYTEEEFQEVLDALKLTNISLSYIQGGKPGKLYLNNIAVIEKATGEKWEVFK